MSLPFDLDRTSPEPLYRQVERQLRAAIDAGRVRPGHRVPSVRALATDLDVGRLTVATAYEQLAADGYLVGRVGFGTIVAPVPPTPHGDGWVDAAGPRRRPPHDGPIKRPAIEAPDGAEAAERDRGGPGVRFDLRPGSLGGAGVAVGPTLERLLREAWRDLGGGASVPAHDPAGDPLLRAAIAAHVRTARGGRCEASQVVVLSGALIGMAAVARLWLAGGATAVVEDPGDPALRRALAIGGASVAPVPVDRHGLRVDALPTAASVALVSPTVQAATGVRMPLARRLRLLDWAGAAGAIVVEDALADELALGAPAGPSLQGLDEDGRVVHLGAFASILHPGVQLGYAVLPADLVDAFRATVAALDPGATPVQQRALGRFLADGHLDRHLARVRRALADRHDAAAEAIRRGLGWLVSVEPALGGSRFVISVEDEAWSAADMVGTAATVGVGLASLSSMRVAPAADREVVVDVGRHEPGEIREAIRLVSARIAADQRGAGRGAPRPAPEAADRRWSTGGSSGPRRAGPAASATSVTPRLSMVGRREAP